MKFFTRHLLTKEIIRSNISSVEIHPITLTLSLEIKISQKFNRKLHNKSSIYKFLQLDF